MLLGVRIVVWNLSHWQKPQSQRVKAWAWLRDFGTDVALLQETDPPDDVPSVVYRPIGATRRWGSAVIGLTTEVGAITQAAGRANSKPANLVLTHPGAVAIGTVGRAGRPLTLVSMYGLIDDGYADTTVNRMLTDLVPLFDNPILGREVVLGGDLNITTQWVGSQVRYRHWERATFDRIAAFGLRDCLDAFRADGALDGCGCLDGDGCRHLQTQYHPRSTRPWQNDYVFASTELVAKGDVTSAYVVDDPAVRPLSDHLPLVLEMTD